MKLASPFPFSQSSLQDYTDCPRRFQLRFIEHLHWPAVETEPTIENERRQIEGQLFHRLVQQHIIGIPAERLSRLATTANLERWWRNYISHPVPIEKDQARHAELSLSTPVSDQFRLVAKYDLILIKPGSEAIIIDWKTNARRPKNEFIAARWQTRVYPALLARVGDQLNGTGLLAPEKISMLYWYADHPTEPAHFVYSTERYKRDWNAIVSVIKEISTTAEFPKTEDEKKCAFCVYRSYCERGVTAGLADDVDDESPEDEINFEQIQEIAF